MIKIKETGKKYLLCGEKMEVLGLRESKPSIIVLQPCENQTMFRAYPDTAQAEDKDMIPGCVGFLYDQLAEYKEIKE